MKNSDLQENDAVGSGMKLLISAFLLTGLGLLIAAQILLGTEDMSRLVWMLPAGAVMLALAAWHDDSKNDPAPERSTSWQVWLVLMILLMALPMKIYHIQTVPLGYYNDEMAKGMNALRIMHGAAFKPFWVANKEFLYFYLCIPFIWFFGG